MLDPDPHQTIDSDPEPVPKPTFLLLVLSKIVKQRDVLKKLFHFFKRTEQFKMQMHILFNNFIVKLQDLNFYFIVSPLDLISAFVLLVSS